MLDEEFHPPRPPMAGFVYLMRNCRGRIKIGHSVNPLKRRSALSSADCQVSIVTVIPTQDMIALETDLQRRYAHRHVVGEWYDLSKRDLAAIRHLTRARPYVPGEAMVPPRKRK